MNPVDLDKDTIRLLAHLMSDQEFEEYLFYYCETMDDDVIELIRQHDKQLTKG